MDLDHILPESAHCYQYFTGKILMSKNLDAKPATNSPSAALSPRRTLTASTTIADCEYRTQGQVSQEGVDKLIFYGSYQKTAPLVIVGSVNVTESPLRAPLTDCTCPRNGRKEPFKSTPDFTVTVTPVCGV